MIRLAEVSVFAVLAVAAHILFFVKAPDEGMQSGGSGGEDLATLSAAAATVVEMVETWEAPVEVVTDIVPQPQAEPPSTDVVPSVSRWEMQATSTAPLALSALTADAPALAPPDISTPPAPPEPEVKPETLPKAKPVPKPVSKPKPATPTPVQSTTTKPKVEATKSQVESAGRAAQKAAGSGGGSTAGNGRTSKPSGLSAGAKAKLVSVWGGRIQARIRSRIRAPSKASVGMTVHVSIVVQRDGALLSYKITRGSGDKAVDNAVMNGIKRAGRLPKLDKKAPNSQVTFNFPVVVR